MQIEQVKSYFNEDEEEEDSPDGRPRPDTAMVFQFHAATKEDVLAALPEKHVVDRLVSRYFNSNSPVLREFLEVLLFIAD